MDGKRIMGQAPILMFQDKNLWNVAGCRVHLFCAALIIFNIYTYIYNIPMERHDVYIVFVLLCIEKHHTE